MKAIRTGVVWLCLISLLLTGTAGCGPVNDPSGELTDSSVSTSTDPDAPDSSGSADSGTIASDASKTNTTSRGITVSGTDKSSTIKTASTTSVSSHAVSGTLNITKKAIMASSSAYDTKLLENPDRGFRMETKLIVDGKTPTAQADPIASLREQRDYYLEDYPQVAQAYFYLTGYRDTETLPAEAFTRMQAFFDAARRWNIKLVLRFAYQYDQSASGGAVSPGGSGEAKQSIILAHLEQLKPLLEKNKDIIHVMQLGLIGAWGEWHSYSDEGAYAIDEAAIVKKLVEITPADLYVQVRYPGIKNDFTGGLTTAQKNRLSYHNDSIFGYYHAWTKGVNPGTLSYKQITEEAAYMPQDGEMFWGWQITNGNTSVNAFTDSSKTEIRWQNIVGQLAEQRYSTFSLHHSYREPEGGNAPYSMAKWKLRTVTPQTLNSMGLFYSESWFKDSKGRTVERNAFEYLRDYLGYRLELKDFSASGKLSRGESLRVSVDLTNYGFSAAFNIQSGFAVLDENGKVISKIKAGNPSQWHSRTPGVEATHTAKGFQYIADKAQLTHQVSATIKLPSAAAVYQIAFYAESTNGQFVLFANDMMVKNGYHILETVTVS